MTIDDMIAVLQAAKAGKHVEARATDYSGAKWINCSGVDHSWNFDVYDFRVKPEPREFWLGAHAWFDTKEQALLAVNNPVHVREVLA